jgi:hypothetical protein
LIQQLAIAQTFDIIKITFVEIKNTGAPFGRKNAARWPGSAINVGGDDCASEPYGFTDCRQNVRWWKLVFIRLNKPRKKRGKALPVGRTASAAGSRQPVSGVAEC